MFLCILPVYKVHKNVYNKLNKSNRATITTNERTGNQMEVKLLKPYRGFEIEKSYETNKDGTIKKDSVIYTAYAIEDGGLYDGAETLAELKRKINSYLK